MFEEKDSNGFGELKWETCQFSVPLVSTERIGSPYSWGKIYNVYACNNTSIKSDEMRERMIYFGAAGLANEVVVIHDQKSSPRKSSQEMNLALCLECPFYNPTKAVKLKLNPLA